MIYDRRDHKKMKYDPLALKKARVIAAELEDYYPMQCEAIYVLHTNWFFKFLWALIKNFLSKYIRNTVKMISNKKLLKHFDESCLLAEHGGNSLHQYDKPHTPDIMYYYEGNKQRVS